MVAAIRARQAAWASVLSWVTAAAALGLVFYLYQTPDFLMLMSNLVWLCT